MTGRDIVDDIDALIDEQLAAGETGQARRAATAERRCGHCGRAWHGLAITAQMEKMRREYLTNVVMARMRGEEYEYAESAILGDYRYADDDSTVLCPGSEFIGPLPSTCDQSASLTDDDGCQCPNCLMWRAVFGGDGTALGGLWQLPDLVVWPDNPFEPFSWQRRSEAARWWRLDVAAHQDMDEFTFETEGVGVVRGMVGPPARTTLVVRLADGRTGMIPLVSDPAATGNYAHYTCDADGLPLTLDIHAARPHDLGGRIVWNEIDGPDGDYVRSRALISSSRVDRWFDDLGLWFLAPRELRAVGRRLMGFAVDDGGPIRPGRTRTIPDGAPYLPSGVSMPQRGDTVGYEIGGRVYTGVVTDIEPGERDNEQTITLSERAIQELGFSVLGTIRRGIDTFTPGDV